MIENFPSSAVSSGRRRPVMPLVLAAGLLAVAAQAHAQPAPAQAYVQQQREIEQQIRAELGEYLPPSQAWQFDAGAWMSFYLLDFDDSIQNRTQRRYDSRVWAAASGDRGTHQFYGRMQLTYLDWNSGDSYDRNDDDLIGPRVDRLWYQFDLRQAARVYGKTDLPFNFQTRVGRQYVEFGTGYALSLPLDAVVLRGGTDRLELTGLISRTAKGLDDLVDPSRPFSGQTDRCFLGIQARYLGDKHSPFAYVFWNLDENDRTFSFDQSHGYDSVYAGLGSTGELLRYLRYSTELVYEGGKSFGDRQVFHRDTIDAWAYDARLQYLGPSAYRPIFDVEYMFASGDGDRALSPISALGGNTRGTDTSFVGFGYRDTGLALAPRLSNIHIWRAGASLLPLPRCKALRRLRAGSDWFLYAKHKGSGAISDFGADRDANYLGWEMDYYVNWQITQELTTTARYGVFFPGDAFSNDETRTFFLLGITYSF